MTHEDLRRLAELGVSVYPPSDLDELADWCEDYCYADSNAAYCLLAKTIRRISTVWNDPVTTQLATAIDVVITHRVSQFLAATGGNMMVEARFLDQEITTTLIAAGA